MVSKKLKGMLVAAAAGAMAIASVGAFAQAPAGGPPGGGGMRPGGGGGFQQPTTRAEVIQRYNLNAAELKLTDAQKGQIDKLADAYLEEMKKVPAMQPGTQPTPEAMQARQAPRQNLVTAVGKVLTDDQRKTFEAAQAQRRGPGGGGGPGGPGGPPGAGR